METSPQKTNEDVNVPEELAATDSGRNAQAVIDRVTRLYKEDVLANRFAKSEQDIPLRYELITPEWLTATICKKNNGAKVVSFELGKDDDGTSNRRRLYLNYNEAGTNAGLPKSVFCKASQSLQNRLTLGVVGCTHAENTFYNQVRERIDFEAPRSVWANYDPESFAAILILEDLGENVEFCDETTDVSWDEAVSQVNVLAQLHGSFYQSPELGTPSLPFTTWTKWWTGLEAVGMEKYTNKGVIAAESVIPSRLFKRHDEIWQATVKCVERHHALPHTLLHSDVHLKNWYRAGEGRMGLGDWQSVCVGNWGRDYAYAITCALSVQNRRKWERDLLEIYLEQMRKSGAPVIAYDDAWTNYRQQLFSALAFWTVTLTPPPVMPDMQPATTTLAFIERFAHAIDDLDSLDSFS